MTSFINIFSMCMPFYAIFLVADMVDICFSTVLKLLVPSLSS